MADHLAVDHDDHQLDREALAWLQVQLGAAPLVPELVRERANPSEIISAALSQLGALAARVGKPTADFGVSCGESLPPITHTSRARSPGTAHLGGQALPSTQRDGRH